MAGAETPGCSCKQMMLFWVMIVHLSPPPSDSCHSLYRQRMEQQKTSLFFLAKSTFANCRFDYNLFGTKTFIWVKHFLWKLTGGKDKKGFKQMNKLETFFSVIQHLHGKWTPQFGVLYSTLLTVPGCTRTLHVARLQTVLHSLSVLL